MPRSQTALAALALLSLAGCATAGAADEPALGTGAATTLAPSAAPSPHPTASSLAIDNCGTEVAPAGTPERIVAVKSTVAELLVELGLGDRIVGAAFLDGALEPPYAEQVPEVPVMSDFLPGQEATLALEPDAVLGGWESNFSADGVGERDALHELGILTYVAPSACKEDGYQPDPMTFDLLFEQIAEAGTLLDADDAAATLVERLSGDLAEIEPSDAGLTALWYSSGSDTPYVGAGIGAPQMIMTAAGLTNIFADVHDTWTSATWEAAVAADPDVVVLVDSDWNTADHKIEVLEGNPATAAMTAVREGRYVTVPFAAGEAGVRSVEAAASLAAQVDALEAG